MLSTPGESKGKPGAISHSKFDDFMSALEADPAHAEGFKEARGWVAGALYGGEEVTPKVLRLRAGLTQVQLAALLETSQPQIAKIESGRHDPSFSTCRRLCKALNVSLDVLGAALEAQALIAKQKGRS